MLTRLVLPFVLAGSVFAAGQSSETLRSPDLNQLPKEQFQQLLSKALNDPPRPDNMPQLRVETQNRRCSIPLLESKVEHMERFNMPKLSVGKRNLDPMRLAPPAPECRNWNQSK